MTTARLRCQWEQTASILAQQVNMHRKRGRRLTQPRELMPALLRPARRRRRQPKLSEAQFLRTLRLLIPPGMKVNGGYPGGN
jgi:hypothetical protein